MTGKEDYLKVLNAYFKQQDASQVVDIQAGQGNEITISASRHFLQYLQALSGDLEHLKINYEADFSDSTSQ